MQGVFMEMQSMENMEPLTYDKIETGRRIRALREKINISRKEMAESSDSTEKELADIEEGKCSMSLETALRIAAFFDVTIDDLTGAAEDDAQVQQDREEERLLSLLENSAPQQLTMALEQMRNYLLEK